MPTTIPLTIFTISLPRNPLPSSIVPRMRGQVCATTYPPCLDRADLATGNIEGWYDGNSALAWGKYVPLHGCHGVPAMGYWVLGMEHDCSIYWAFPGKLTEESACIIRKLALREYSRKTGKLERHWRERWRMDEEAAKNG